MYKANHHPIQFNRATYVPANITAVHAGLPAKEVRPYPSRGRGQPSYLRQYDDSQADLDELLAARKDLVLQHHLAHKPTTQPPQETHGYSNMSTIAAEILFLIFLAGCTDMQKFDYRDHLRKEYTLNNIVNERPAYQGELFFVQKTNSAKTVASVDVKPIPNITVEYLAMNGELSITPAYEKGAEKGMKDFVCSISYTDGSQETIIKKIKFTPETTSERRWRIYGEDQAAQSNLRKGIWANAGGENEGHRFMLKAENAGKEYTPGIDFVVLKEYHLTKKGLQKEADMDAQQAFSDMFKPFSGKATYGAFEKSGVLKTRKLKGMLESTDYILHALLDAASNSTEVALQTGAVNDGMAQNISGTYNTLDGALQAIKDATITGGGHMRTWRGTIRFVQGKKDNFQEGQLMSETLNTNDYYLDVRFNPLRNTIETVLTVGHDIWAISGIVKAAESGGNKSSVVPGPGEPAAPGKPTGLPGEAPW